MGLTYLVRVTSKQLAAEAFLHDRINMKLLKDPLLQFLVIGAMLWIGHTLTTPAPPLVIQLPADISGDARQQFIDQQVLTREARRLGLQYNDSIIERQLQQKMRLLLEANATQDISDADLEQWISEQGNRYHQDAAVTLQQRLFRRSEFAEQAQQKATEALQQLSTSVTTSLDDAVDQALTEQSQAMLRKRFGKAFASAVFSGPQAPNDQWQGPVQSGLGWHVFRVIERHASQPMPFEAAKHRALLDWRAEQEQQAFFQGLEALKQQYVIAP